MMLVFVCFVQAIIQPVLFIQIYQKILHSIFVFILSDSLHDGVSFFNINIHDSCCDGRKCIEAKEKHASDRVSHVRKDYRDDG